VGLLTFAVMGEETAPDAGSTGAKGAPAPPPPAARPAPGLDALPAVPIRYSANVMVLEAPVSGIVRLRMTVEGWTDKEDRVKMFEALKTDGTNGLVAVMEKMDRGWLQVDNNLRWPIRVATIWKQGDKTRIRIATNRPIYWGEVAQSTRSLDYPFGLIELTLPPEGKGEGTLVLATQVGFDKDGRVEVRTMPQNTGPQRVSNVVQEKMK
jgi:hypothetical protein